MRLIIAQLLVLLVSPWVAAQDTPEQALLSSLDRIYTWGDVVETLSCRVHGWWLRYGAGAPASGHFWGDLTYRDGKLRFVVDRTLGPPRASGRIQRDLAALFEQAGLLPTGFPVPAGEVIRARGTNGTEARYRVVAGHGRARRAVAFRVRAGRMVEVTAPWRPGRRPLTFEVRSRWIPSDRYLVTALLGRRGPGERGPRVVYDYHYLAGNYFPHAITEDRQGESLSFLLYNYEIDLAAP